MLLTRPYSSWELGNYLWMRKSQLCIKQICFPSIISNVTNNKNDLWNTVKLTSLQKPQLPSPSIFFKVVHPRVLLYMLCFLYLLILTFWVAIFMFHLIWWHCSHCTAPFRGRSSSNLWNIVQGYEFTYWGRVRQCKIHVTYRKIPKISPTTYKPLKPVTQKTLR